MEEKTNLKKSYEILIEKFRVFAESRPDVRAAFIVGSRARTDHAADEWADLDIVVVTTQPDSYIASSDWTQSFGNPLLTFVESTSTGDEKERRVLYQGMLDVDFAIIPQQKAQQLLQTGTDPRVAPQMSNLLGRGIRILTDKDGMANQLQPFIRSTEKPRPTQPTQQEFLDIVSDFMYHAVFTAKHLRRGELWWTATCLDCHMQMLMLRMIEWHALATHNWNLDVWFRGRFMEEWAHPEALEGLHGAFAHYDAKDIKDALLASMNLFRRLALETAKKLGYNYPEKEDEYVIQWIKTCIQR